MTMRTLGSAVAVALLGMQMPAWGQTLTRDYLVGTWSFDGSCASGYGMGLQANGEQWFDEWGQGLWALDGDKIRLIVRDVEMGTGRVLDVIPVTIAILSVRPDRFEGRFAGSGQAITATRCD